MKVNVEKTDTNTHTQFLYKFCSQQLHDIHTSGRFSSASSCALISIVQTEHSVVFINIDRNGAFRSRLKPCLGSGLANVCNGDKSGHFWGLKRSHEPWNCPGDKCRSVCKPVLGDWQRIELRVTVTSSCGDRKAWLHPDTAADFWDFSSQGFKTNATAPTQVMIFYPLASVLLL